MVSVQLDQVTKRFGDTVAADAVSLAVEPGELFFLLGPSGCGKSTLLRTVAGFCEPDGGQVLLDGRDVTRVPPHRRSTGMVFQNYALWPHMTVEDNVGYGLEVRSISSEERQRRINEALEMVRMAGYGKRKPNQLSGGQQQRVALARALVIRPDVVLLDEPLSNLDAKLRLEMRDEIRRIHRDTGITTVYVTHDQKEALSMADRIAVMDQGRVVQIGRPEDLYRSPANLFVAQFVGETNLFHGKVDAGQDGTLRVTTALGDLVSSRPTSVECGSEIACSIRPEALQILRGEPQGEASVIQATVSGLTYLGEVVQYDLSAAGDQKLRSMELNPRDPPKPGEAVRLSVAWQDVVLFRSSGETQV